MLKRYQLMPGIDDFVMMILGMSEVRYDGVWIIGNSQYEYSRPAGWPMAKTVMDFYGFDNWKQFVDLHIGANLVTGTLMQYREKAAMRTERRAIIDADMLNRRAHRKLSNQQRQVYNAMRRGLTTVPQMAIAVFGIDDKYTRQSIHSALWRMRKRGVKIDVKHSVAFAKGRGNSIFRLTE
jgi:hypothetical protein